MAAPASTASRGARLPPAALGAFALGVAALLVLNLVIVPRIAAQDAAPGLPPPATEPASAPVALRPEASQHPSAPEPAMVTTVRPEVARSERIATAPVVEPLKPVVETPTPVIETTQPVVETPKPVVETPTPVVETAKRVVETPTPVIETPTPEPVDRVPTTHVALGAFDLVLRFPVNGHELTSAHLGALAAFASGVAGRRVSVDCHADRLGDSKWNQILSARRCSSVRDALATLGIAPARLDLTAHGEDLTPGADVLDADSRIAGLRRGAPLPLPTP